MEEDKVTGLKRVERLYEVACKKWAEEEDMWIAYIAFERDNGRFENVKKVYSRAVHALKDISGFEEKYNLLQAQGHLWRVCQSRRQLTGQERPHGAEETRILRRCRANASCRKDADGAPLRRLSRLASHLLLALRRLSVLPLTPCCLAHHHSLLLRRRQRAYTPARRTRTPPAGAARRPSSPAAPAPPPGRADSKRHVSHPHPPRASAGSS